MDRKLKNTLVLLIILVILVAGGGAFGFLYQKNKLEDKRERISTLEKDALDTDELKAQLEILRTKAAELDSILSLRKFVIPVGLKQSAFFDFVNDVSTRFSSLSFVNIEYENVVNEQHYNEYVYVLSGTATFNDFFKLVYASEHSKELKKISSLEASSFINVDDDGVPHYLVNFSMKVAVFFSENPRFSTAQAAENKINTGRIYDIFFPLIRNEIPPNSDGLLDVQTAHLLALIPDGAYLTDASGRTHLLWEGDKVYMGYLTKIDYKEETVKFILNKGGIIEKVTLEIEKETKENGK